MRARRTVATASGSKNGAMKHTLLAMLAIAFAGVLNASSPSLSSASPSATSSVMPQKAGAISSVIMPKPSGKEMAQGRVLVKFRKEMLDSASPGPQALGEQLAQSLNPRAKQALIRMQGRVSRAFPRIGVLVIETQLSVSEAIERLYLSGVVEYAQPDFTRTAFAAPNDPDFASQWAFNNLGQSVGTEGSGTPDADIDAVEAWNTRTDASSVLVGVVDTGVDYTHPDLTASMWTNPGEVPGNGIDDDGNGYIDDVHGVDTFHGTGDPIDTHSHGTHVAGIIGAAGNNGVGVSGVAWSAQIMALRFMPDGYGYDSDAIEAIEYVLATKERHGYQRVVLNNSWGGGGFSQALYDAIAAAGSAGVLFIASAGNDSTNTDQSPAYPASYDLDNIVSVGATDFHDSQAYFSNFGCSTVDIFAPGTVILSTIPGNGYAYYSGTSMASPVVAGMAAIVWSQAPGMSWESIKGAVLNGVDKKSQLVGKSITQGRANLRTALGSRWRRSPSIFAVDPSAAPPGQELTISGVNFGDTVGTASAFGMELEVTFWSSTKIQVVLPSSALGTGTIQITSSQTGYSSRSGGCVASVLSETLVGRTILPHGWHAGVRQGRNVWLIGGYRFDGTSSALVERYTPGTGQAVVDSRWALPVSTTNASGATVGGLVYVVGGYDPDADTALDVFQVFDPAANTWTLGPSLPAPRIQPTTAASGGKIYVFGGLSDANAQQAESTVLIYNPATASWSVGSPMPEPVANAAAVALGSGQIWIMGGSRNAYFGTQVNTVQVYDSLTDSWSHRPGLAAARFGHGAARTSTGKFVVLHGADSFGRDDGELKIGSKWNSVFVGPAALYTPSATAVGQDVYVISGYDFYSGLSDRVFRVTVP